MRFLTATCLIGLALGAGACLPAAAVHHSSAEKVPQGLWDVGQSRGYRTEVSRVNPQTLRPIGQAAVLGAGVMGTRVASPGGKLLAFGSETGQIQVLRISDLRTFRPLPVRRFPRYELEDVDVAAWPTLHRLLGVATSAITHGINWSSALVIDPLGRRIVDAIALHGLAVGQVATRQGGMAVLVIPNGALGPARLVFVDARGTTRSVSLPAIDGSDLGDNGVTPAVSLAADGSVLVVAAVQPLVAMVDPATLAVHIHRVAHFQTPHAPPGPPQWPGSATPGRIRGVSVTNLSDRRMLVQSMTAHPHRGGKMVYIQHLPQILSTETWRVVRTLPSGACQGTGSTILCVSADAPNTTAVYTLSGRLRVHITGDWSAITGGWLFAGRSDGSHMVQYQLSTLRPVQRFGHLSYRIWPFDLIRPADLLAPAAVTL